ncbi:hypothetical protein [Salipiger bermudensis]|uniref:hypothetical protein n=1 Tax=Salipiger bermudensis TaxID=344736 RepID=UPI0035111B43
MSRLNPEQDWVIHDVPELRIVTDALWDAVKRRKKEIDATPAVQGIRKSRFWEKKRSQHLLTGKLDASGNLWLMRDHRDSLPTTGGGDHGEASRVLECR